MVKRLIHAFNPFNGTPFKTAFLLLITSVVCLAAAYVLNDYTLKEVQSSSIIPATAPACDVVEG